jgi:hypothetical protein
MVEWRPPQQLGGFFGGKANNREAFFRRLFPVH